MENRGVYDMQKKVLNMNVMFHKLCVGSFHVKSITQNITPPIFMKISTVVGSCENIKIFNKNLGQGSLKIYHR